MLMQADTLAHAMILETHSIRTLRIRIYFQKYNDHHVM